LVVIEAALVCEVVFPEVSYTYVLTLPCGSLVHFGWFGCVVSVLLQMGPVPEAYCAVAAAPVGIDTELGRSVVGS
jgi:hypothetical protein